MKISIQIEGATPEEAQRVLIGMSFAEDILGKISPAVRIEKAQQKAKKPGKKTLTCVPWADNERDIISLAKTPNEAADRYKAAFPASSRKPKNVRRMWQYLESKKKPALADKPTDGLPAEHVPEGPDDLMLGACRDCDNGKDGKKFDAGVCDKCSPPPEKKTVAKGPVRPGPKNKHGIPDGLATSDPRLYARLLYRINKGGMTYEEALAREGIVRAPIDADKVPSKKKLADPVVKIEYVGGFSARKDTPVKTFDVAAPVIVTGMHVKQVRPDAGRQIFGTGVVTARRGEICEVRNGGGKVHKILAACLEPATGTDASDRATGASS